MHVLSIFHRMALSQEAKLCILVLGKPTVHLCNRGLWMSLSRQHMRTLKYNSQQCSHCLLYHRDYMLRRWIIWYNHVKLYQHTILTSLTKVEKSFYFLDCTHALELSLDFKIQLNPYFVTCHKWTSHLYLLSPQFHNWQNRDRCKSVYTGNSNDSKRDMS